MQEAHDFTPISYRYCATEITVELRSASRWCVSNGSCVCNRYGKWEYEPLPSNRGQEFFERTRYSLEEAFEVARKAWRDTAEQPTHPAS